MGVVEHHPQFSKDMLGTCLSPITVAYGSHDSVTGKVLKSQLYRTLAIPIYGPIFSPQDRKLFPLLTHCEAIRTHQMVSPQSARLREGKGIPGEGVMAQDVKADRLQVLGGGRGAAGQLSKLSLCLRLISWPKEAKTQLEVTSSVPGMTWRILSSKPCIL